MKVKSNPRYEVFLEFLEELAKTKRCFSKWRGVAFRAAPLEFARLNQILNGMGALKFGGRWSAPGAFRAVNLSLTQETALKESGVNSSYYGFASSDVNPKVLVGVRLKLGKVIDLTNLKGFKKEAWLRLDVLLAEDWRKVNDAGRESQSQALGRAAHDFGAEAILAPSVRVPNCVNLVFFPESTPGPAKVEILGEDDLKKWLRK